MDWRQAHARTLAASCVIWYSRARQTLEKRRRGLQTRVALHGRATRLAGARGSVRRADHLGGHDQGRQRRCLRSRCLPRRAARVRTRVKACLQTHASGCSSLQSRLARNAGSFRLLRFAAARWSGLLIAVVGESGSGKTTLANCIAGFLDPTQGAIRLEGKRVTEATTNARVSVKRDIPRAELAKVVQMVFQDPSSALNPRQTIGSALLEPLRVHKVFRKSEARLRVEELLELTG